MRTGGKILIDISKNTSPDVSAEDIIFKHFGDAVSIHVTESTQRLISKLRGRVPKRVRRGMTPGRVGKKPRKKKKRARVIKRDLLVVLFSHIMPATEIASVSSEFDIFAHRYMQTTVLGMIKTS